jgi:uncharacterized membrane protein (UPF0127 family)
MGRAGFPALFLFGALFSALFPALFFYYSNLASTLSNPASSDIMNKRSIFFRTLAITGALLACNIGYAQQRQFPVISLNAGIIVIKAEVASTEAQREQGLMNRERLGPNEGMVFLFPSPQPVCMWMRNTLIPLSVAFIDHSGKIVNIEEMKEQTDDTHCGKDKVSYALEMSSGWFSQKSIKPGMTIDGLPGVH